MTVLITGGSGFIGTALARRLDAAGRDFRIGDIAESRTFPGRHSPLDITSDEILSTPIAQNAEAIAHLAAVHRDDVRPVSRYDKVNVDGTRNVAALAERARINRIVFTSTVAVYGFAAPDTDERGTIDPFNDYGRTKAEAEDVLRDWQRRDPGARSLTILRPTVVFGPGNRGNVFNLLNQMARGRFVMVGNGRNRKSMAYVDNVAAFIDTALGFGPALHLFNYVDKPDYDMDSLVRQVNTVLNGRDRVGPRLPVPVALSLGHGADLLAGLTGRSLPVSAIRVRKFVKETSFASAAHDVAGFVAPVSLAEGLRRTLEAEFLKPDPNSVLHYTE